MSDGIIKRKVFTNLIWRYAERCGAQLVSFAVQIVLARIIAPEAFGTISLVLVFSQVLQVFVDSGLGNALIQKKDADDLDFSSVFYFNMLWCIVLYGILCAVAPLIARFYGDNSLVPVIRVLCFTVVISGLKNVQQAYVSKTLQFKSFFFATLGGTVCSAVAGIGLALKGAGVWALVAQKLINLFVDTVILWITVKWHPKWMFSFSRLKRLLSYGWKLLAASLVDTLYGELQQLVIGKMYSPAELAYFNRGKQFPNFIAYNINASIDSVLLPVMAMQQQDRGQLKNILRRSFKTSIFIMAPLMMGLCFMASSVVSLLLSEEWLPCVFFMKLLCVMLMLQPIGIFNRNAIKAMGYSAIVLKLEVVKKLIGIVLLVSAMWFGVRAIAVAMLITELTGLVISSVPNWKLLDYKLGEQLKDVISSILLALAMGAFVWGIGMLLPFPLIVTMLVQIVSGAVFYVAGSILTKNDSFKYLYDMLQEVRKRRK